MRIPISSSQCRLVVVLPPIAIREACAEGGSANVQRERGRGSQRTLDPRRLTNGDLTRVARVDPWTVTRAVDLDRRSQACGEVLPLETLPPLRVALCGGEGGQEKEVRRGNAGSRSPTGHSRVREEQAGSRAAVPACRLRHNGQRCGSRAAIDATSLTSRVGVGDDRRDVCEGRGRVSRDPKRSANTKSSPL